LIFFSCELILFKLIHFASHQPGLVASISALIPHFKIQTLRSRHFDPDND